METPPATRSNTEVYLLGSTLEALYGSKLPAVGDVLRLYIHKVKFAKTKHDAAVDVVKEVQLFWDKARIPMRRIDHVVSQLEELVHKWEGLKKNKARRSTTQIANEQALTETFHDLFDVAHCDALQLIKIEEDRQFLLAQRKKGRQGFMAGVDMSLAKKEEAKANKHQCQIQQKKKQQIEIAALDRSVALESSGSSSDASDEEMEGATGAVALHTPKRKRGVQTNIMTPAVLSALDRTKTSDRQAVQIIAPILHAAGENIEEHSINRSSIRRYRQIHRANLSMSLKTDFNLQKPMVLHWDGKLMEALTGDEKVDRLPIIVSGSGTEQLLRIPKLSSGTGQAIADALMETVSDWGIVDNIKALSFDTTASYTGRMNGACTLFEQRLGRNVLHLACRHHIHEIMLEDAFSKTMGPSSGPDILLFKRFKTFWPKIFVADYKPGVTDPVIAKELADVLDDVKTFVIQQVDMSHPRDDYRELLELALIFAGGVPSRGVSFRKPGAIHHARFMSRLICAMKMYILRHAGFMMTDRELRGVGEFCIFGVVAYTRSWFLCPLPTAAPVNDLNLLKLLASTGSPACRGALKKLCGQLWYLSEELVALSFFDQRVGIDEKRAMVTALNCQGTEDPPKRITVDSSHIISQQIHNFITHNTRKFFCILSISDSFLSEDPETWATNEAYLEAEAVVKGLRVVNDTAERGVALMQDYNAVLTKDEDQMQFVLQVVKEHRKCFPDSNKSTLRHGLAAASTV